jgi:hypothetical protein
LGLLCMTLHLLPFVLSFFGCLWMKSPIVGFRN